MEVFIEIFEMTHPCNDFIFKRMQIRHLVNRWKNGMQLFGYNERMWAQTKSSTLINGSVLSVLEWWHSFSLFISSWACVCVQWRMVGLKRWWIQRSWPKWELLPSFNYCVKLNYLRNQKTWPLNHRFIHTSYMRDFLLFASLWCICLVICWTVEYSNIYLVSHFCGMILFQQLLFCCVKTLFNGTAAALLNKQD